MYIRLKDKRAVDWHPWLDGKPMAKALPFPKGRGADGETKFELLAKLRNLEIEKICLDWCISTADKSPRAFLMEDRGWSEGEYENAIKMLPAGHWYARRREIQAHITESLVKAHVDFVCEMNDTHIK